MSKILDKKFYKKLQQTKNLRNLIFSLTGELDIKELNKFLAVQTQIINLGLFITSLTNDFIRLQPIADRLISFNLVIFTTRNNTREYILETIKQMKYL